MKHRVLLVSYSFPPIAGPESYLSAKTLGAVPDCDVDVVSASPEGAAAAVDNSLDAYVRDRFRTVRRISFPGWVQQVNRQPFAARVLKRVARFPDSFAALNNRALAAVSELDPTRYDAVVTWSTFASAHLVGLEIRRRWPGGRWLAHFSDPWLDNPFVRHGPLAYAANRRWESQVMHAADRLVFTSDLTVDLVMKKYGAAIRQKACVVPHPFDASLYPAPAPRSGALTLRYLGAFYGPRSPVPLIRALIAIHRQDPQRLVGVRFELVGAADTSVSADLRAQIPRDLVQFRPAVDYMASLREMVDADALLVIDAPAKESVFLPSKLIDYLGAGRPILGITPPGTSATLIREARGTVADPSDQQGIMAGVLSTLDGLRSRSQAMTPPDAVVARYTVQQVGQAMQTLISSNEAEHSHVVTRAPGG